MQRLLKFVGFYFIFIIILFFLTSLKSSIYAGCTWRCNWDCAAGEIPCEWKDNPYCDKDYIKCCTGGSCPSAPTNTPRFGKPTYTPVPTKAGVDCSSTAECKEKVCKCPNCIPNCSAVCINGKCHVTNPTPGRDKACSDGGWGPWSACTCDKGRYEGCSSTNYCGQVRFCNDPGSNHYQINCCILGSGNTPYFCSNHPTMRLSNQVTI